MTDPTATIERGYAIYFIDNSFNNIVLTMPPITGDGAHFYLRNINTSNPGFITTILPDGSDTIENGASYQFEWGTFIHLVAFGTNWYLIC